MTPDWLEPMAATLTQERFAGPDWILERKLGGIRLLVPRRRECQAAHAQLTQRHESLDTLEFAPSLGRLGGVHAERPWVHHAN